MSLKVVVLMSTYNGERFIREQIDSILAQRGEFKLDLIVRDDGSTDSTQQILQKYKDKGKLNWYTGQNLGPAYSFLDLVKKCKDYDYYAFADQDDVWFIEKIIDGLKAFKNQDLPYLYFANAELVDSELNFSGRNVYKATPCLDFETLICSGGLLGCTMIFNNILAKKIQSVKLPNNVIMHDYYVAALCLTIGGCIIYDKKTQLKYRQHGGNVVGIETRKLSILKSRLKRLTIRSKVSIADQANELIPYANVENREWLLKIAMYRKNIFTRISLAISRKTKYMNRNTSIRNRISIFLGNR